jgi:hypothetical protein
MSNIENMLFDIYMYADLQFICVRCRTLLFIELFGQ